MSKDIEKHPRAAPNRWPYIEHRTLAEVWAGQNSKFDTLTESEKRKIGLSPSW